MMNRKVKIITATHNDTDELIILINSVDENNLIATSFHVTNNNIYNRGFSAGINEGLKKAKEQQCDYALIVHADTRLTPNLIGDLIYSQQQTGAGAVSPLMKLEGVTDRDLLDIDFACVLLPMTTFDTVGIIEEGYHPLGYEDADYKMKIKEKGLTFQTIKHLVAIHKPGKHESNEEWMSQNRFRIEQGRSLFTSRWGKDPSFKPWLPDSTN